VHVCATGDLFGKHGGWPLCVVLNAMRRRLLTVLVPSAVTIGARRQITPSRRKRRAEKPKSGRGPAMTIVVDAMGGDHAPEQIIKGAIAAARESETRLALVGMPEILEPMLPTGERSLVDIVPASSVVSMDDSPGWALRNKRDSSLAVAVEMVRDGRASAVVSAGNSGAFMAMAVNRIGRIPGIARPAIAIPVPTPAGDRVVLDAGANTDCHPEHLLQFAVLGSVYCERAMGIKAPRVGLLSIGTEETKGNDLTRAAHALLRQAPLNYAGCVEGNDIFEGQVDVIVCDGFVGNVLLKAGEGLSHLILSELRQIFQKSLLARIGLVFMYPALRRMRQRFDYASYGGALLLGVRGIAVVCHGRSDARAIRNAIRVAEKALRGRVVEEVAEACERLGATVFHRA
jgi:glycerol-3-phosphate acyltransferase PlsX